MHADPIAAVQAARAMCTREWPDAGGAPLQLRVRDLELDDHALARLSGPEPAARNAWAWLCSNSELDPVVYQKSIGLMRRAGSRS